MNRRLLGTLGALAALVGPLAGCKNDPLSDLDGTPAAIVTTFTDLVLAVGDSTTFRASVVDGRSTPLTAAVTFSACDGKITVVTDASYQAVPPTSTQAKVKGVSAGTSCVTVAGGGLQATVNVTVN